MRTLIATVVVLACAALAPRAEAQGWAEKMFKDGLTHNFGSVPRGAQLFHRFTITNIYAVPMEIVTVKSGCGCVTAAAAKVRLEPRESTTIDVNMDARRFTGPKTVAIRVSVGPEFISSAELKVSATSRADIVFNPGQVSFGVVTRGQVPVQTIDVEYAGALDWRVSEVVAKDVPFEVAFKESYRQPGRVGYQVEVKLKADAPTGAIKQKVFLKTNDPTSPLVPVLIEATVQTPLSVVPSTLSLGTIKTGEALTRRVVVRGSQPFKVTTVEGTDKDVALGADPAVVPARVQTVTFRCQFSKPGPFRRELKIRTDLEPTPVTVVIEGNAAP